MIADIEIFARIVGSRADARHYLAQARLSQVDPLLYFVACGKLSADQIYERIAKVLGLVFSPTVPTATLPLPPVGDIDQLSRIRSIRGAWYGREVLFLAPDWTSTTRLAQSLDANPDLRSKICIVPPPAIKASLTLSHQDALLDSARQRLAQTWPRSGAHLELGRLTRIIFVAATTGLTFTAVASIYAGSAAMLAILGIFLVLPSWFRLSAIFDRVPRPRRSDYVPSDHACPTYTIMVPMRDEHMMVDALVRAIRAIDYPSEKLDVKFVVESESQATIDAVRAHLGDPRFELVIVPDARPRTKPKALNFALPFARGDFLVIYDAEDVPEPDQLRLAAARFLEDTELDCQQAELFIDNANENGIAALFATEYSGLFSILLPALARRGLPMPLGGTSNHFRTSALRQAGGWDAYNVTEDADLGIRMVRHGHKTATLASRTFEEAPATLSGWLKQRTRWIKGWMQTFIVHNRHPLMFLKEAGWTNFLVFQIYVGGLILSAPLHLAFLLSFLAQFIFSSAEFSVPSGLLGSIQIFILIAGYLGSVGLSFAGALRRREPALILWQIFLPIYWALNGIAAFRALFDLLFRPFFWDKTQHGVTSVNRRTGRPSLTMDHTHPPAAAPAGPLFHAGTA